MDTLHKRKLFTEMMIAVGLHNSDSDTPPKLNMEGLADRALREAVIAQACRFDDDQVETLCLGLCHGFMETINSSDESDEGFSFNDLESLQPNPDVLAGLGIAIYLSWLLGQNFAVLKLIGLLGVTLNKEGSDHVSFLQRIFAPPPITVTLKDAYLSLDSLEIIETNGKDVFDQITEHIANMPMGGVKKLLKKEGYDLNSMENSIIRFGSL